MPQSLCFIDMIPLETVSSCCQRCESPYINIYIYTYTLAWDLDNNHFWDRNEQQPVLFSGSEFTQFSAELYVGLVKPPVALLRCSRGFVYMPQRNSCQR